MLQLLHADVLPPEKVFAARATLRAEQAQPIDRETPVFQDAQELLSDRSAGTDYGYVLTHP
jgi:hypothetical protein